MKISKRVAEQLDRFVAHGPQAVEAAIIEVEGQRAYIVGLPAEGAEPHLALTVADYDRYSVTLLNLEVNLPQAEASQDLQHYAAQVAKRITYLEEPLSLVELATEQNLAQLRSQPPQQEDGSVTYWEALIWTKPQPRATLTRYRWSPGQKEREAVAYPATITLAGRMAEDLAGSLVGVVQS